MRSAMCTFRIEKCGENDTQMAINHTLLLDSVLRLHKPIRMDYWYPKYAYTCVDLRIVSNYIKCLAVLLRSNEYTHHLFYNNKILYFYL